MLMTSLNQLRHFILHTIKILLSFTEFAKTLRYKYNFLSTHIHNQECNINTEPILIYLIIIIYSILAAL